MPEDQESDRTERVLQRNIEDFYAALMPLGSADVRAAVQSAIEGGHDGDWAADKIRDFMEDTGSTLDQIDPNAAVYDALLQEARNDIEQAIQTDILNDTTEQIEVAGNCMCTSLDYTEGAKTELIAILAGISPDNYTDAINWLISEVDIAQEVTDARDQKENEEAEA